MAEAERVACGWRPSTVRGKGVDSLVEFECTGAARDDVVVALRSAGNMRTKWKSGCRSRELLRKAVASAARVDRLVDFQILACTAHSDRPCYKVASRGTEKEYWFVFDYLSILVKTQSSVGLPRRSKPRLFCAALLFSLWSPHPVNLRMVADHRKGDYLGLHAIEVRCLVGNQVSIKVKK